jgi:hypothetical protein
MLVALDDTGAPDRLLGTNAGQIADGSLRDVLVVHPRKDR